MAAGNNPTGLATATRTGLRDTAMRRAWTCYDHLAGQLAVAMADRMAERGDIELSADGGAVTDEGACFLESLGVDLGAAAARAARRGGGRMSCRPCLDWSERRPHIVGRSGPPSAPPAWSGAQSARFRARTPYW